MSTRNYAQANGVQRRMITELRTAGDEFALVGYAATFNSWSKDLGGFREQIGTTAFARSLRTGADVKALFNHDPNNILGRTKSGTLQLSQDGKGLKFHCQLDKNSQYHRDLHASVKRGDIDECSFAFTVPAGGQSWTDGPDPETGKQTALRTLLDVDLIDVSVVTYPAYNKTGVDARAVKLYASHGIIDAVKTLRQAAAAFVRPAFRCQTNLTGFRAHLDRVHQQTELTCMMAQRCEAALHDDPDADDEDEVLRGAFRAARSALDIASESFAKARLRHELNLAKKCKTHPLNWN